MSILDKISRNDKKQSRMTVQPTGLSVSAIKSAVAHQTLDDNGMSPIGLRMRNTGRQDFSNMHFSYDMSENEGGC